MQENSSGLASAVLVHPDEVPVPPKRMLKQLYNSALQEETGSGDQTYLKPAGLLSLEEVLLPSLGKQENEALKQIQSKIQRDAPEYKGLLEDNRRLVGKAIARAIESVQQSRGARCQQQQKRREEKAEGRRLVKQARKLALVEKRQREEQERQKQLESERRERKRVATKQYPKNQELWKEIVFLTSSIAQLEKEERMWIQAEQQLIQKQSSKKRLCETAAAEDKESSKNEEDGVIIAPKHPLQKEAEQRIQDIAIASTRIQSGLDTILKIMDDAEKTRKELYHTYTTDHQFEGYQQVHDPKSMIRFLSQDD